MKINGVLEGGLLENRFDVGDAEAQKIGRVTCGPAIASPYGGANVAPLYVGRGDFVDRLTTQSEVNTVRDALDLDIDQTNLRVTALESSLTSGANSSTLQSLSSYSFTACSIGTQPPYTFLRLLSSSSPTSSISVSVPLAYILSTDANTYGLTSSEFRLVADNSVEFSTPPLAWSYDLTQSQTHAAPYTVIESFYASQLISSSLFTEKHDASDVFVSFSGLSTSQTDAVCKIDPTISVVSVYDVVGGVADTISKVEFIVDGYKKYVMPYDTFASLPNIQFTLKFRHNYYGDRDTFSFISSSSYKFFKARLTSRVYRL